MQTEELIEKLTADMRAAPRNAVSRRFAIAIALGGTVSLLLLLTCFGMREDMGAALSSDAFWIKCAFVAAGALPAFFLTRRLARPDGKAGRLTGLLLIPVVVMAFVALARILNAPMQARTALWLGQSARECVWMIAALSIPVFAATIMAFRGCAPTRLSLAGFTAGLLSGTVAAFVYTLCCNETEPAFIVTWYTLGMLLPALGGAIVGPRLLRW